MVIHHALGISGGARGVVEANCLPLIIRPAPSILRVAFGKKRFVIQITGGLALPILWIIDIDHQGRVIEHADRRMSYFIELAISNQHLGLAVLQHERNSFSVQTHI